MSVTNNQRVSSGSPFETSIGFSRARRIGNHIAVAGTAPLDANGHLYQPGDVYAQTRRCLEISLDAIQQLGGCVDDVIRTRILLTNIDNWEMAAQAHGEFFAAVKPACTFVEVKGFIDPAWLVETEIDCIVS